MAKIQVVLPSLAGRSASSKEMVPEFAELFPETPDRSSGHTVYNPVRIWWDGRDKYPRRVIQAEVQVLTEYQTLH